jgi:acetyltransferase-like isoleucine patch superfamily enzyme
VSGAAKVLQVARAVAWLLPSSPTKNALLRRLGHPVHPTAVAHPCLVWGVDRVELEAGSSIGTGNLLKHVRRVALGEDAAMGRYNVVSAHPVYRRLLPGGSEVVLETGAKVTSRHHLDGSGGVRMGAYASLAGHGTLVLTHSVDLRVDAQTARPATVGHHAFVGARCILLGGSVLPERSVLGAGSVLTRSRTAGQPGLWAGSPATRRGDVAGAWFERTTTHTRRILVPETGDIIERAF